MSFAQMKSRCGNLRFVKRGHIIDHKFVYDGISTKRRGAVANTVPHKGEEVWGGIFEINELCERILDGHEGVSKRVYYKDNVRVYDDDGNQYICLIYIGSGPRPIGKPSEGYRSIILKGASDCKLPTVYVSKYL